MATQISSQMAHQARLAYTPDIKSSRPRIILTRRLSYPMRMPYGKRGPYHKPNNALEGESSAI